MTARVKEADSLLLRDMDGGRLLRLIPIRIISSNRHADVLLCSLTWKDGEKQDIRTLSPDQYYCLKVLHTDEECVRYQFDLLSRLGRTRLAVQADDAIVIGRAGSMPPVLSYGNLLPSGAPYVLTPWVKGSTLLSRIVQVASGRRVFTAEQALSVLSSLADALTRLAPVEANQLLVHRDVKPSNIVVLSESVQQVMLVDYDTAAFVGDLANAAPTGTFGYAAPETFVWVDGFNQTGRIARSAADVFSFGIVAHEVLTGHWPYPFAPRPSTGDLWRAFFTSCEQLCIDETLPQAWKNVLMPCLSLDPTQRPDVHELPELLGRLVAYCDSQRLSYRRYYGHDPLPTYRTV